MNEYFKGIKIGDRVWSFTTKWGTVIRIDTHCTFPVVVKFDRKFEDGHNLTDSYTMDGSLLLLHDQSLFWNEIKFEIPPRPLPDLQVDAKVYVRVNTHNDWKPRHFRRWDFDGTIVVFNGGQTSFTNPYRNTHPVIARYRYWKLEDGTTNCPEE